MTPTAPPSCDVLIVGAGFGGLGAALRLAESGARVVVCETLRYPGGCASTFGRSGWSFDAGATLFAGLDEGQLFGRWITRHGLPVQTVPFGDHPVVELRTPQGVLAVPSQRAAWIDRLCQLPGAPEQALRRFFARQERVANALWALLDDERLLPPFDLAALGRHLGRAPRYLPLVPLLGRTLESVLRDDGVADFAPLRLFCDAVCQITVQTSAEEAEAAVALSTLDYFFRGARHVEGGVGALAWALTRAIESLGGQIQLSNAVRSVRRLPSGSWQVDTRRGPIEARAVVLNLLPHDALRILGDEEQRQRAARSLAPLADSVEEGWGACMLYLGLRAEARLPDAAHHLELVADPTLPFIEGNHLFCSISSRSEGRGPEPGQRAVTCSTHLRLAPFLRLSDEEKASRVATIQRTMRHTLEALAPELASAVTFSLPGSPRTFARFTGRHGGFVGGVPRRAGLHNYRRLTAPEPLPGLWLVGDSIFPGQSTLACALGGVKVADRALSRIGRAAPSAA